MSTIQMAARGSVQERLEEVQELVRSSLAAMQGAMTDMEMERRLGLAHSHWGQIKAGQRKVSLLVLLSGAVADPDLAMRLASFLLNLAQERHVA